MTIQFQVGRTYATRSICDHECIFSFTILGRTAKTVTVDAHHNGKAVRRGLSIWNGVEQFSPFGTYSMSPTISADKECMTKFDYDRHVEASRQAGGLILIEDPH